MASETDYAFETVKVTLDEGIAWVALNRPAKRNAMSPTVNREMKQLLDDLEIRADVGVIVLTGEPFDGRKAAEMGLVNRSVPLAELRETTEKLARTLLSKNPTVLRHAKSAFKFVESLDWDTSEAMLGAMAASAAASDPERGRKQGMAQFLDEKSYRPGLGGYRREG